MNYSLGRLSLIIINSEHYYSGKVNTLPLLLKGFIGPGSVFWVNLSVTNRYGIEVKGGSVSVEHPY